MYCMEMGFVLEIRNVCSQQRGQQGRRVLPVVRLALTFRGVRRSRKMLPPSLQQTHLPVRGASSVYEFESQEQTNL